jgi:hypothetical protein
MRDEKDRRDGKDGCPLALLICMLLFIREVLARFGFAEKLTVMF